MGKQVECSLCKASIQSDLAIACYNMGKIHYECMDTSSCSARKKSQDNEGKAITVPSGLTKEEQIEATFGVSFDDLIEWSQRLRDGSVHYLHNGTKNVYSWTGSNKWIKADQDLSDNVFVDMAIFS